MWTKSIKTNDETERNWASNCKVRLCIDTYSERKIKFLKKLRNGK